MFDALRGIDAQTLKIVNQKIQEIRDQYNHKIMKQSLVIEDLSTKLINYQKTDESLQFILKQSPKEVFKLLPKLERDPEVAFNMFVMAYGEL